jgi:hypothetical protein
MDAHQTIVTAALAGPPHHLWIGRNRADSCPLSDRPTPASIPADILALGPSCVSPAAQLKRE